MQLPSASEHDSHRLHGTCLSLAAPWLRSLHADLGGPPCGADDVAASPSTKGWAGSHSASPLGQPRAARELLEPGSSSEQSDDEPAAFPQSPAMARATAQAQGDARSEERAAFPLSPAGTARAQAQAQAKAVLGQQHGASSAPRRGVQRRLVPGRGPLQGSRSSQGDAEPQARPLTQLQRPAALMQLSPGTDADLQVRPSGADLCHIRLAYSPVGMASGFLCRSGCLSVLAVTTAGLMSMLSKQLYSFALAFCIAFL